MLILDSLMMAPSSKARLVIKMLIVNPIPPRKETPRIYRQFRSAEMVANFVLTATKEKKKIPANFPIKRPVIIPMELGFEKLSMRLP